MAAAKHIFSVFRPFHPAACEEPPYHEWVQGAAKRQAEQEAAQKAAADLQIKEATLSAEDRKERIRLRREAELAEQAEQARLRALANELALRPTDPNIIPTMAIDPSAPKRSDVFMDDPPIWVVPFARFRRHGRLPVYPECIVPLTSVDLSTSLFVFLSHAWVEIPGKVLTRRLVRKEVKEEKVEVDISGFYFDGEIDESSDDEESTAPAPAPAERPLTPDGATKGFTLPDTFSNTKWELLCEAIERLLPHYAPEMDQVYLWLDVSCVPSEHEAEAEAEASRLGLPWGDDGGDVQSEMTSGSDSDSGEQGEGEGEGDEEKTAKTQESKSRGRDGRRTAASSHTNSTANSTANSTVGGRVSGAAPLNTNRTSVETGPYPINRTYPRKAAGAVGVGVIGTAAAATATATATTRAVGTSASASASASVCSTATTATTATAGAVETATRNGSSKPNPTATFVPRGSKPLTKQEIRQNNRERDNDPDVSIGKQLNMSSMSRWGLLLFDRVMMYMDCMLTVVPDEGYRDEPWALSNSGLGMHCDYKAKNWQRYLSRRWCRLEMSYCANIPLLPEEEYQVCMYVM